MGRAKDTGDAGNTTGRQAAEPMDTIELQTAVLVRNLEMIRRRSDFYLEADRAGYLLLRTLDALGESDISTLAAALGLDPSTTGRQVAAAQKTGLVERSPGAKDRRRSVVSLTADGRDAMAAILRRRWTGTAEILEDWSDVDRATLATMFTRYNQAIASRYLNAERRD
jgi:DNA-binding MarR family transcriptional regulator